MTAVSSTDFAYRKSLAASKTYFGTLVGLVAFKGPPEASVDSYLPGSRKASG